ncbi:MAG TPA: hypothetical protein VHD58_04795 [Mycobacteriales bacterium]|nr:hypothetical protein [Mycobacteriales bacterium]
MPSTNPLAQTATVPTQLPEGVAPSAPPDPAAAGGPTAPGGGDPAEGLKWPCTGCGAQVPMAEDYCPDCGTGFLSQPVGLTTPTKVPLIGDLSSMNSGQKLMFGIAIATGVVVGMLALLFIGGTVFK